LRSFSDAHVAATLIDGTIDKPYSTSEQYLERWANLIEKRLAKERNLTPKIKKQVAVYQRTVDGAAPKISDSAFRERQAVFERFIQRMTEQNFGLKKLLLKGSRQELEAAINVAGTDEPLPVRPQRQQSQPRRRSDRTTSSDRRKLYTDTIRPAWKQAVDANQIPNLTPAVLKFEKYLLSREVMGSNYFTFRGTGSLKEEAFWQSGYSNPQTLDAAKAEAIVRWSIERHDKILSWAGTSTDANVQAAAEKLLKSSPQQFRASSISSELPAPLLDEDIAAARTLFYRRVLAAWQVLLAVNERPALAKIRELTELERTPLPDPMLPQRH
jgi:hypothetical protein